MSKLTLDEAIKRYLEVAEEQSRLYSLCPCPCDGTKNCMSLKNGKDMGCTKCAAEHRQLAEWLTELKQWRRVYGVCPSYEMCIPECKEGYNAQIAEYKRLLKAAVEDIKDMLPHTDSCDDCALNKDDAHDCSNSTLNCDVKCKWRYTDEALKLIES